MTGKVLTSVSISQKLLKLRSYLSLPKRRMILNMIFYITILSMKNEKLKNLTFKVHFKWYALNWAALDCTALD